ncbi:MAG: DASS family sodium-coupled anion symporter [Bacteroidetes bacterium]|jgi:sodium-dependent dicarboxylate transporter 2/3/5|nr:DASS family sodium-coupled anion symporter [Bacteroidota bacterium]
MSIRKTFNPNFKIILILISLAICYQFHGFQQLFSLTHAEEIALVILIGTAVLWVSEALPLYITSLAVLFFQILWLLPVLQETGIQAQKEDFLISFFGDITLLFMGGFVLAALLNKYGLSRMIARLILEKTGSSPSKILMSIILVSAVLSMWMSNTATAAMMFAILGPVIMGLPDTSPFTKGLALAIPFACNLGGIGTPIGTPPNAIAMEYLLQSNIEVTFAIWMLIAIPLMLVLLFALWKLLLKLYPPGNLQIDLQLEALHTFGKRQYFVTTLFFVTIFGWLTSGYTGISNGMVGLFVVIVAFGGRLLETRDFKNISWDILFMLGGGLCLGAGLKISGLTDTIAGLIPTDGSFWIILVSLLILASVMTTFMSNTATANLLIPVAVSLPHGEIILTIAISFMCSSSMALPISTPPNAIAFGSGFLDSKEMLSSGLWVTFFAMIGIIIACSFYLPLIV